MSQTQVDIVPATHSKRNQNKCHLSCMFPPSHHIPICCISHLEHAKSLSTLPCLSKMGFNRNIPYSVVFVPHSMGGLGLLHMPREQSIQHILHCIKPIRWWTTLSRLIMSNIGQAQLYAGTSTPFLLNNVKSPSSLLIQSNALP